MGALPGGWACAFPQAVPGLEDQGWALQGTNRTLLPLTEQLLVLLAAALTQLVPSLTLSGPISLKGARGRRWGGGKRWRGALELPGAQLQRRAGLHKWHHPFGPQIHSLINRVHLGGIQNAFSVWLPTLSLPHSHLGLLITSLLLPGSTCLPRRHGSHPQIPGLASPGRGSGLSDSSE